MSMHPRLTAAIFAVAAAITLSACGPTADTSTEPTGDVYVAAPDGSGSGCRTTAPCALADAIGEAGPGDTVELLDGEYGDITIAADGANAGKGRITIQPAEGANPEIGKLELNAAGSTWADLTFTGGIYLDVDSDRTRLDGIHIDESGLFVRSTGVVVTGALIENGTSIDGVQISGAKDLIIENSIVRGFAQGKDSDVHSDCVQLFDSSDIILRGNYFGACDNAALIFSPGGGEGIENVLVESNYLQGCIKDSARCSQGTSLDLREPTAVGVTVRNNTMLDGSVMVDDLEDLVFDRNIVGYVTDCAMPMTNSIVVDWNKGQCDEPDAIGSKGNRIGKIEVVDRKAGDLRLTDESQALVDAVGSLEPADAGYGGAELAENLAGAGG